MIPKIQRFHGLDGLRGVCAITVLLFHCVDIFRKGTVFAHGYLSVDVFFVLSGFVIALTYEQRLRTAGLKAFLKARAQRLFPVYWLGNGIVLIAVWCVTAAGHIDLFHGDVRALVATSALSMFLIPNLWDPSHVMYPENPVVWSLFGEWIANILYGSGLFRLSSRILVAIVAVGWSAMTLIGFHMPNGWCGGGSIGDIYITLLRAVPGFTMGVLLYRAHAAGLLKRLPVISAEWMFLAWIALAALPTPAATPVLDALIAVVAAPLIIVMLIRAESSAPAYCKFLGEISYPLYTVHIGFVLLATHTFLFGADRHPNPVGGIVLLAVSIAVAWGIAKLTSSRKPAGAVTAVA
jgi:peptidoglycan/LPS O-acetylase OafA/YrhL